MLVHELFMRDTNIFQKLSKARSILSDAFSRELGEDDMEELEKELQHLERWEFPTDEKLAKFEKEILK